MTAADSGAAVNDVVVPGLQGREGRHAHGQGDDRGIRRSLKEGLLGDAANVRASRTKTGPFDPLRSYPEFRDLVVAAMATPGGQPASVSSRSKTPTETLVAHAAKTPSPIPFAEPTINMGLHIPLETNSPSGVEGLEWIFVLLAIAASTAYIAFHWLPK